MEVGFYERRKKGPQKSWTGDFIACLLNSLLLWSRPLSGTGWGWNMSQDFLMKCELAWNLAVSQILNPNKKCGGDN